VKFTLGYTLAREYRRVVVVVVVVAVAVAVAVITTMNVTAKCALFVGFAVTVLYLCLPFHLILFSHLVHLFLPLFLIWGHAVA
jgi:hypothetical protein